MIDYYLKYKEYKKKYLQLEKHLDNRFRNISAEASADVSSDSNADSPPSLLNNIIKKLNKKGYIYWLTEEGKIITKNTDGEKALNSLHKKIKKNKDEYKGKIIIKVDYALIDPSTPSILDGSAGPIQMGIYIHKVEYAGKNISLAPLEDHDTLRLYYFERDLSNFKLGDMKKFAIGLLEKRELISPLKIYTYKEAKKLLK